jgi:hypothetical protein
MKGQLELNDLRETVTVNSVVMIVIGVHHQPYGRRGLDVGWKLCQCEGCACA